MRSDLLPSLCVEITYIYLERLGFFSGLQWTSKVLEEMKRTQNYSLKNRLNDKEGCICLSRNSALRCSNKALGPRCITLDRDYAKAFGEDKGLSYI